MANKKKANAKKKGGKKGKGKGKKPNTSLSASASSRSTTKNTKKRNSKKKSTSRYYLKNPLPSLGDVSAMEWLAFVFAAILSRTLTGLLVHPDSWKGIGLQAGLTLGVARFAPKSVRTAATLGAGGGAVLSAFNSVTNNAVPKAIVQYIGPIIPWRQQVPATQVADGNGSGVYDESIEYSQMLS